jgi:hypothetical protein
MHYLCYGRKFKVEKMDTGDWCAVGRARGRPLYVLDRLGSRPTESEMQTALDVWAKHVGATKVAQHEAPAQGWQDKGGQLELFSQRVGAVV